MSECTRILLLLALIAPFAVVKDSAAQDAVVRDPTRPFVQTEPSTGGTRTASAGLDLTAVIVSPSRRIAVINGRFYREGERVNGELITGIEPGAIRIRRNGEDIQIKVNQNRVVTTRPDGVKAE